MSRICQHIMLACLLLLPFHLNAQNEEKVIVHLKDGQQVEYDMSEVDYVELVTPPSQEQSQCSAGGTIGTGVDLGLSVLWASHNLGAEEATDIGGHYSFEAEELSSWGEDWRLPTAEEWQELYDKCSWSWEVCDGIGGRLIKSTENQNIFIPAGGVQLEDDVLVNGCVGIYWTADTDTEHASEAVGTYFDSANIYRIEYPKTDKFSVRLVKNK